MRYLYRLGQSLFIFALLTVAAPVWAQSEACGASSIDYADEAGLTQEERIRRMDAALMRSLNQYDECQDDEARERKKEQQDPDSAQQSSEGGGTSSASAGGAEGEGAEGAAAAEDTAAEGQARGNRGAAASAAAGDISGSDPGPGSDPSGAMALPGVVPSLPSGQAGPGSTSGTQSRSSQASDVGGETSTENLPAGSSSAASGDMAGTEPVAPPRQVGATSGGLENDGPQTGRGSSRENSDVAGTGSRPLSNGKLPGDIPPADNDSVLEAQIRQAAINETDPELKKKLWNEYRRYKGLPQVD